MRSSVERSSFVYVCPWIVGKGAAPARPRVAAIC